MNTNAPGATSLDDATLRQIHAWREGGRTWPEIDDALGRDGTVKHAFLRATRSGALASALGEGGATGESGGRGAPALAPGASKRRSVEWSQSATSASIEVRGASEPPTEDGMIAAMNVDLDRWEPSGFSASNWPLSYKNDDGEMVDLDRWAGKIAFKRRPSTAAMDAIRAALDDLAASQPVRALPEYAPVPDDGRHLYIIAPVDVHNGMMAWGPEVGIDYDSTIAARLAEQAVADLVHKARGYHIEKIMVPLGHDWLHADRTLDGVGGTTTKGTHVEVDGRWQKMFRAGHTLAARLIEVCCDVAPVEVVMVPGNHDEATAFYLGEVLAAKFERNAAVTVSNEPAVRHYRRFGVNGFMMAHGHREPKKSLAGLFVTEAPDIWFATTVHDGLFGHLHRAGVLMCEETGFRSWELPSLAASDGWHAAQGLRHRQACQALLYHHDRGYVGQFEFTPTEQEWHWSTAA